MAPSGDTAVFLQLGDRGADIQLRHSETVRCLVAQVQLHHRCRTGRGTHHLDHHRLLRHYAARCHNSSVVGQRGRLRDSCEYCLVVY